MPRRDLKERTVWVLGLEFRVWGLGVGVEGLGFRVLGFRVWGLWLRV